MSTLHCPLVLLQAPCVLQLPCLPTSALHPGLQEGMDMYNETYGYSENSGVGLHHKAGDRRWAVEGYEACE